MHHPSVASSSLLKFKQGKSSERSELLAVEEPLEIVLEHGLSGQRKRKTLAITMRTPGNDLELVTGFLYSEAIIHNFDDLVAVRHCAQADNPQNTVKAFLSPEIELDMEALQRHFYTSSSCGVCGKTSLKSVAAACPWPHWATGPKVDDLVLRALPKALNAGQSIFQYTGGVHAAALFELDGTLVMAMEDVGRHNALDKLIGYAWHQQQMPWSQYLLVLSGRISYELMQKAVMAGARTVVAMGAPSSLAVAIAQEFNVTLIGFLKEDSYNIYHQTAELVKK